MQFSSNSMNNFESISSQMKNIPIKIEITHLLGYNFEFKYLRLVLVF